MVMDISGIHLFFWDLFPSPFLTISYRSPALHLPVQI